MGFYHEILLIRCVENEVSKLSIFLIQDDDDYVYVIYFHWIILDSISNIVLSWINNDAPKRVFWTVIDRITG